MNQFALQFLQASVLVLLLAVLLRPVLSALCAAMPGLRAERGLWLALLWLLALMLLGQVLPLPRFSVPAPVVVPAALVQDFATELADSGQLPALATGTGSVLPELARLWLAVFVLGALVRLLQFARAWRVLQGLVAGAQWRKAEQGIAVHVTPAPVSPMLFGLRRPVLLWPAALDAAPPGQQALVLAHELAHARRHDPLWLALALPPQVLLWFVPGIRAWGRALAEAIELACDRAVLHGRSARERRDYALAMLAQFRAGTQALAPGFGGSGASGEPKDVGVEIELEQHHRHEDEVGGGVACAVAGLLDEGKLLRGLAHAG